MSGQIEDYAGRAMMLVPPLAALVIPFERGLFYRAESEA